MSKEGLKLCMYYFSLSSTESRAIITEDPFILPTGAIFLHGTKERNNSCEIQRKNHQYWYNFFNWTIALYIAIKEFPSSMRTVHPDNGIVVYYILGYHKLGLTHSNNFKTFPGLFLNLLFDTFVFQERRFFFSTVIKNGEFFVSEIT